MGAEPIGSVTIRRMERRTLDSYQSHRVDVHRTSRPSVGAGLKDSCSHFLFQGLSDDSAKLVAWSV